jgi:hypothetical protein
MGLKLSLSTKGTTDIEGVWELGAEESMLMKERREKIT